MAKQKPKRRKHFISHSIIDPKSTNSLLFFFIGSIFSGFAFAIGMKMADVFFNQAKKAIPK